VTCLLLGWLAIGGFANAVALANVSLTQVAPHMLRAPAVTDALLAAAAGVYGVTALVAAAGLWRMRSWGPRAFLVWVIAVCGFEALFMSLVRLPPYTPLIVGVGFIAFTALILFAWWSYIRRAYVRQLQ
jgi:hypothetical protein